ncbi:MAG: hypothetical protein ACYS0E_02250 [Planctomycetota bacterium]|jgi:hypothetical protein
MNRALGSALLLLTLSATGFAQNFADALPEKTVFFISLDNVARTRERLEKSGFMAMWNDEAMRPLRETFEAGLEESKGGELNPLEFFKLVEGQVGLALIPVGQNKYAGIAAVDMKGKRREILEFIEKMKEKQGGESRETEEEFNGYTITTRQTLREGQEEPESNYYATKDDSFVIAEDLEALKDVLMRRESGEKTGLSRTEPFKQVIAATGERCDLRVYVPASLWLRQFGMMAAPFIAAFGLDGVKGVGGQISLGDDGLAMRVLIQNVGEPRGVLKILGGNVAGLAPPKIMPPNVDPTMAWAIDWQFIYQEVFRIVGMLDPNQKQQLEGFVGMVEQQLGFKIHDDLLACFSPGTSYGVLPIAREEGAEPTGMEVMQNVVLLQKLRNNDAMKQIFAKVLQQDGVGMKESQYLGTTIWEGTGEGEPSFAIVGDHIAMGLRLETLQTLIRRQGKELEGYRDSEAFKSAEARVPAQRSLLVVSDPRGSNGSFFWSAFKDSAPEEAKGLLPGPEFFVKFLGVSVFSLSQEEQGLLFNWFWGVKRPAEEEDE